MKIRISKQEDLKEIVEIINQVIRKRKYVAFLDELAIEERKEWFAEHSPGKYPILVAESDGRVVGWTSISPYRKERKALSSTVEVSYFVHEQYRQRGIGTSLLGEVIGRAKTLGYKTILAIIFDNNTGSIRLLEKFGFQKWGFLPEVAEIDSNKLSHVYYGIQV